MYDLSQKAWKPAVAGALPQIPREYHNAPNTATATKGLQRGGARVGVGIGANFTGVAAPVLMKAWGQKCNVAPPRIRTPILVANSCIEYIG
jgi:hypothetical protein